MEQPWIIVLSLFNEFIEKYVGHIRYSVRSTKEEKDMLSTYLDLLVKIKLGSTYYEDI